MKKQGSVHSGGCRKPGSQRGSPVQALRSGLWPKWPMSRWDLEHCVQCWWQNWNKDEQNKVQKWSIIIWNHDLYWKVLESPSIFFSEIELNADLITVCTYQHKEQTLDKKRLFILADKYCGHDKLHYRNSANKYCMCSSNRKSYQPAQGTARAEAKLLHGSLPSKGRWAIASTYKSMDIFSAVSCRRCNYIIMYAFQAS